MGAQLLRQLRQHDRRRLLGDPAQHHRPARARPAQELSIDFTLTADQELLRETARGLLTRECPPALVRAHIDDPATADPLWEHLRGYAALGGGPLTDLHLFLEETGYVAAPGPFFPTTALFTPLLQVIDHELTAAVLDGAVTGAVALAGKDGVWTPNDDPVKTFVAEADRVDWVAVVSGAPAVTLITSPPTRRVATIDPSRRLFEIDTHGIESSATIAVDADVVDGLVERATVALAAEMVGTARRLFDMTLAYAKERVQFDAPIGSFQAIQHKLADMALELERATSAVQYAAMAIDADDTERHRATHVAKAAAGAAATRAAKDGIQIHGGIGYTWEHDLHLFIRRAYGAEHWLGTRGEHLDRLANLVV